MRTPILAAGAAVLVFGLAACGGTDTGTPAGQEPTAATTPATGTPATPATGTPTTPATGAETAPGGQATADAAGQAFVRSFGTGDARGVCALMAADGAPIANDEATIEECASTIQPAMDLVQEEASQLADATVSGATVSGATATFENATITPDLARSVLESQTAVQINGEWYMSVEA